jgi:hypothetical protein
MSTSQGKFTMLPFLDRLVFSSASALIAYSILLLSILERIEIAQVDKYSDQYFLKGSSLMFKNGFFNGHTGKSCRRDHSFQVVRVAKR